MNSNEEYLYSLEEIDSMIAKKLKPSRMEHCRSVSFTAASFAMYNGIKDIKPFLYAGLLHDCAKYLSNEQLLEYCDNNGIQYDEYEKQLPFLIHGKVGADFARKEYGINNPDILSAIVNHTYGLPGMSLIEKAIYMADHMEPLRDFNAVPPLEEIRKMAYTDSDRAVYLLAQNTVDYLSSHDFFIAPSSFKTLEYYKEKVNGVKNEK